MSDSSLITKYRPQDFGGVIGQDAVVRSVQQTLEAGTGKAFLFDGPPGTGKTSLARLIANYKECEPQNIIEIDAASKTGIDDMRQIIERLTYSALGRKTNRVVILDEAHALSKQAWSSLLKSIEEPPKGVTWVLCTTELAKIPDSIRTRCSTYSLKPVKQDDIWELLKVVIEVEGWTTPEDVSYFIAGNSDGSPRQALQNLTKCFNCPDVREAAGLLKVSTSDDADVINLCRGLTTKLDWPKAVALVKPLEEMNAESIRINVVNYFTKVLMNAKTEKAALECLRILEIFGYSYGSTQGIYPVLLSLGKIVFVG